MRWMGYRHGYREGRSSVTVYFSHHMDSLVNRLDSVEKKYPCPCRMNSKGYQTNTTWDETNAPTFAQKANKYLPI